MSRRVVFYETEGGGCPVAEFIDTLPTKQAQKILWVLKLIEELPNVPASFFKKLVNADDIWEVRVSFGNNIFRLLGFFDGEHLIVLNYAFQKKSQKTPLREIKIVEKRKQEYCLRSQYHEKP